MERLLDAVDRSSPMGKRDYAMFLLAWQQLTGDHGVRSLAVLGLVFAIGCGGKSDSDGGAGGSEIALAGFFAGITPTAIAAPVIISFLRGRVEYVVAAFLLTNVVIAARTMSSVLSHMASLSMYFLPSPALACFDRRMT